MKKIKTVEAGLGRIGWAFHVPNAAPLADSLVAGIAKEHGLTVVTRNTVDFTRFGVPLFNPWQSAT